MTVQELYDWAKERNLLDKHIAKNFNLDIYDIERVQYIENDIAKAFGINFDRVLLD